MPAELSVSSDRRGGARMGIDRETTLRVDAVPMDAQVENLSPMGFAIVTDAILEVGREVCIGLPGVGSRPARVVWIGKGQVGCAFDRPLRPNELALAFRGDVVARPLVEMWENRLPSPPPVEQHRFSYRTRFAILIGSTALLWLIIGGLIVAAAT
ncbi:PilZ domain-containing protein [Sphingomonas sp. IW22]|jgi:hypothetical protein|uniref:PilZ domain-containing protein n=1 Tax=Sphingomonas sp. IW22 TaxID=3242489 RepID=UPI0035208E74